MQRLVNIKKKKACNYFISDVERNRPFMAERAEELIQVQYLGALLRNDSCSCSNTSSALLRGTFISDVECYNGHHCTVQ